jgi:hypothetical protein
MIESLKANKIKSTTNKKTSAKITCAHSDYVRQREAAKLQSELDKLVALHEKAVGALGTGQDKPADANSPEPSGNTPLFLFRNCYDWTLTLTR